MNDHPPAYDDSEKTPTTQPGNGIFTSTTASAPPITTPFASVSLHQTDRIRLLHFPITTITLVRTAIQTSWPSGIQDERPYAGSHEFKLKGRPWSGQGDGVEGTASRILMRQVFATLYTAGWILMTATDISRRFSDMDLLVFRLQTPAPAPPMSMLWMAVSFNRWDRLRFMGGSVEFRQAIRELLMGFNMLQSESWRDPSKNEYEFKCRGQPWMVGGGDTMVVRTLVLGLVQVLEQFGWSLYVSVDQNNGGSNNVSELDVWYCVKSLDWVPGRPVLHR